MSSKNEQESTTLEKLDGILVELEGQRRTGRTTRMLNRVIDKILEKAEGAPMNILVLISTWSVRIKLIGMLESLWNERANEHAGFFAQVANGQVYLGKDATVRFSTEDVNGWYQFRFEDHSRLENELETLVAKRASYER